MVTKTKIKTLIAENDHKNGIEEIMNVNKIILYLTRILKSNKQFLKS